MNAGPIERAIENAIAALRTPRYQWQKAYRRAFVLTWPLSGLLRLLALAALFVARVFVIAAALKAERLRCIWHGRRSMWETRQ